MSELNRVQLLSYGFLALPLAFGGIPLYLYAPDFYATEVGLSLALLGSILLFLRLFDAISDPLWGWLSDNFSEHRKKIIQGAFWAYIVGFVALFNPLQDVGVLWFCVAILLATSGYSVLVIQLNSLGALWSRRSEELMRINGCREAFGLIGLIIAAVLPSVLLFFLSKPLAFSLLSAVLVLLFSVAYRVFLHWLNGVKLMPFNQGPKEDEYLESNRAQTERRYSEFKEVIYGAKGFFSIYGLSAFASACPAVLIIFFVRDYLALEEWTGFFLILYFLSGALFMPLWQRLTRYFDSPFVWAVSMVVAILSFSGVLLLNEGSFWGFALICFASGVAFGAELSIPPTILASYLHRKQSTASLGVAYSILAFLSKLALALSAGLLFWILDAYGFTPSQDNDRQASLALLYCYGLVPLVLKAVALSCLFLFRGQSDDKEGHSNRIFCLDRNYSG